MDRVNKVNGQIREFILAKFPLARKRGVRDEHDLLQSGVLDSLGVLDLVAFVEQQFGIQVSDEELLPENFQTIQALTAFVQRKSSVRADSQQ